MDGERLKLARKRANLSLRGLAEKIDGLVSAQAIGKYERGEMTPGSTVLIALSRALGVSIPYLLAPQGIELGDVDFRTKATTGAKERASVATEVIEWVERYLQVEEFLELDSAAWNAPAKLVVREIGEADAAAERLREAWSLGIDPIPNMTELLEEKGIKVLVASLPEKVSGLTCLVRRPKRADEIPVVVVNRVYPLERRRLTLAHELAHRVVDHRGIDDKSLEKLCTRFAGAFLIPRTHLEQEIGKHRSALGYRELIDLKRLYRVSASALLMRLEQVGVIDQGTKEYAFRTFARTWRKSEPEPLEGKRQQGLFELPRRFERLVYRALAEDLISASKAAELLREPIGVVEHGLRGPAVRDADHC